MRVQWMVEESRIRVCLYSQLEVQFTIDSEEIYKQTSDPSESEFLITWSVEISPGMKFDLVA